MNKCVRIPQPLKSFAQIKNFQLFPVHGQADGIQNFLHFMEKSFPAVSQTNETLTAYLK